LRHHIFHSTNAIFWDGSNSVTSFSSVGPTVPEYSLWKTNDYAGMINAFNEAISRLGRELQANA